MTTMPAPSAAVLAAFTQQVAWCETLGSPFTAMLLGLLAEDLSAGGRMADLIGAWPGDPMADALPLRIAGALHALVLNGAAADLVACYPPRPAPDRERLRAALRGALVDHRPHIVAFLGSPPQTNEVGRSAVLLGGFLTIAARTGLPLRLLEIGASAGLNLIWDRFHYRLGTAEWGDLASPVRLKPAWEGGLPPLAVPLRVAERAACDVAPVDLDDPGQRLRLRAYVWADQVQRLERLDGAIAMARQAGTHVERAGAGDWLAQRLAAPAPGCASVIYHSIMWSYVPAPERARIAATLEEAGERASLEAPLAWLRFEPDSADQKPALDLTVWPGGGRQRLAFAQAHGNAVTWLGEGYNGAS